MATVAVEGAVEVDAKTALAKAAAVVVVVAKRPKSNQVCSSR